MGSVLDKYKNKDLDTYTYSDAESISPLDKYKNIDASIERSVSAPSKIGLLQAFDLATRPELQPTIMQKYAWDTARRTASVGMKILNGFEAVSNATYYAITTGRAILATGKEMPAGVKEQMPFKSMRDAISKGLSGKEMRGPADIVMGALPFVPITFNEQMRREANKYQWSKIALTTTDIVNMMAADVASGMVIGRAVKEPIKILYKANKIKHGSKFADNTVSAVKQYLNIDPKVVLTEEDVVQFYFKKQWGEIPSEFLSEGQMDILTPIRKDKDIVKTIQKNIDSAAEELKRYELLYDDAIKNKATYDAFDETAKRYYGVEYPTKVETKTYDVEHDVYVAITDAALDPIDDILETAGSKDIIKYTVDNLVDDDVASYTRHSADFFEKQKNIANADLVKAQYDLKDAQSGRYFATEADEVRAIREEYIRAYGSSFVGQKGVPKVKVGNIDMTLANYLEPDRLARLVSNGMTDDLSKLSPEELSEVFENVEMIAENIMKSKKDVLVTTEYFSPAFYVFKRFGAENVYHYLADRGFERMRFSTDRLKQWSTHLKAVGLNPNKKFAPDSSNPILRRIFLAADGIDIYNPELTKAAIEENMKYNLTDDEWSFIAGTMGQVKGGKLTAEVIDKERQAAAFVRHTADELGEIGVKVGRLYRPVEGVTPPEGAVPFRNNYITHLIDTMIEDADVMEKSGKYTEIEGIADFFERTGAAAKKVDIDQLKKRQGVREGLIQNADTAFRAMLNNETNAFVMEPAYKGVMEMVEMTGNEHLIKYTTDWINYSVRGIPHTYETKLEKFARQVHADDIWNFTIGKVFKTAKIEEGDMALKKMSAGYRRFTYTTAMGFNISSAVKNASQSLMNIPVIGFKGQMEGLRSLSLSDAKEVLKNSNMFFAKGVAIHELSIDALTRIERAGSFPFRWVDKWINTASAFNGALWKQISGNKRSMQILAENGYTGKGFGKNFWEAVNKSITDGYFKYEIRQADEIAQITQYSYATWDMPKILWSSTNKTLFQFATWPLNYFGQYIPELTRWAITGVSPLGKMSRWDRSALLRHVVMMETAAQLAQQNGVDVGYISPTHAGIESVKSTIQGEAKAPYVSSPYPGFSPFMQGIGYLIEDYTGMSGGQPTGLGRIQRDIGAFAMLKRNPSNPLEYVIPGSAFGKVSDVVEGDKSPLELFGIRFIDEDRKRSSSSRSGARSRRR